ncbi:DeoR/GlpR family DNA-binding transcription regulator [Paenibacillus chondroitinus]|uniref:DeoR/GlpR family DNA-binding transcription regulator n=1 Tax=Paenibacillus chondroitinus TaxID=59842 RepID=A0ABU6D802_9BACL|nr:DeoR/GlpR family DNA-binding transcription regulator [Paenibacillus chondroitinus]MCY9661754.1 DeoR/GlpR family DNA-binding transcription regulator [Paenibacillus anseongense]MEB4793839.1 DeoR/GlpR family DNA-binding transcription regulator [Paenibacillus chondroitinus]
MLAAERKFRIVEYVKIHRVATIAELAQEFNVHEATIRRDLEEIEQKGLAKRTHGGVTIDQWTHNEPSFNERVAQQFDQKDRIGKMAASMVEDGEHIIIDSGTTTLHIAKNLVQRSNITVVTNDMNIATELRDAPGIKVIVTGGDLYPSSYMLNGMFTDHVLGSLHVQKAFIGIPVIHPKYGLMHPEAQLVPTKKGMINAAEKIIVVADDSKIGKVSLHTVAPCTSINTLITGSNVSENVVRQFRDSGMDVIMV